MKTMLIAINLAFLCLTINAQTSVEALFDKYAEKENATRISINKNVINLISDNVDEQEALKDVNGIDIVVLENENNIDLNEYKKLLASIRGLELDELMTVRSNDSNLDFLYNEDGKYLKNLIMLARSEDGTFLLRLDGKILKEKLGEIDLNIQGMNELHKLGRV